MGASASVTEWTLDQVLARAHEAGLDVTTIAAVRDRQCTGAALRGIQAGDVEDWGLCEIETRKLSSLLAQYHLGTVEATPQIDSAPPEQPEPEMPPDTISQVSSALLTFSNITSHTVGYSD